MENSNNTSLTEKVNQSLERVRPYLISDGGNVELVEVTDDMIVRVKLTGACHGCPYSMMTLKSGIEQAVIQDVPEIKSVEAVQ
jgi:Fe-S cluster biogenesis protein NfuA